MRKLLSFLFVMSFITVQAQTVTLKFSAYDIDSLYLPLHHVVAINWTQDWRTTVYWPDTELVMQAGTGIENIMLDNNHSLMQLSQNNPNPFYGTTTVNLSVTESGKLAMEISDINGRVLKKFQEASLQRGTHQFRITLSTAGVYFLTVRGKEGVSSVKMVNMGNGGKNAIEHCNVFEVAETQYEPKSSPKDTITLPFVIGDQMSFIGYAEINGILMQGVQINQSITTSQLLFMPFLISKYATDGQPCPGMMTCTDYDDNVYNTVWIGTQCWMKENLRTTHYADGSVIPAGPSTSTITACRYAPNGNEDNVSTYGYLYNWPAVMHGGGSSSVNPSGVQGICPDGWHVPSNIEWTAMTNHVESRSQYVCGDDSCYIAKALADTMGWNMDDGICCVGNNPSINNSLGFSALPAGYYFQSVYHDFGKFADFWTATEHSDYNAEGRYIGYNNPAVGVNDSFKEDGCSVRCVRDPIAY